MDYFKIIAEIVGFIASFILLFSATRTNDRDLIILQGVSNALWIIHCLMFNAISVTFNYKMMIGLLLQRAYKIKQSDIKKVTE